jgi:hypothetical protein
MERKRVFQGLLTRAVLFAVLAELKAIRIS